MKTFEIKYMRKILGIRKDKFRTIHEVKETAEQPYISSAIM